MGYEQKIHSHLECYMSLDGIYVPSRMTGCWLSPLGFNKHDLSIQEGYQPCWFMLLLNCSGHVDVVHQEHI